MSETVDDSTAQQWQPIETAPRDFTSVLLVWHPPLPVDAKPAVVQARWLCRTHCMRAYPGDCPNEPKCDMGWDAYAGRMSHWMPLPPLPEEYR